MCFARFFFQTQFGSSSNSGFFFQNCCGVVSTELRASSDHGVPWIEFLPRASPFAAGNSVVEVITRYEVSVGVARVGAGSSFENACEFLAFEKRFLGFFSLKRAVPAGILVPIAV